MQLILMVCKLVLPEHLLSLKKKDVETEIKQNAKDRLQIDINVDNVRIPGGIKNVLIPVWSDINGQDDLIWYTSKKLDEIIIVNCRYS